MGRSPKQTFLQRKHTDGHQAHENMLNIANYQRNANQNHNEVSPHTNQNGHHQNIYNPTPGHISRKGENFNLKRYMHPNVHSSTIYNSQDMEITQAPITDNWFKKMCYRSTVEYYSTIKRIMPFAATWMDLENIILSEVSQRKVNTI